MKLTKQVLVDKITEESGYPKKNATELVDSVIELIKSALCSGEDVLISGFGKFCVRDKRERVGRNPATGNALVLSKRRVVTFKCSGKLREKINKS